MILSEFVKLIVNYGLDRTNEGPSIQNPQDRAGFFSYTD